jgi:hypothetical protein
MTTLHVSGTLEERYSSALSVPEQVMHVYRNGILIGRSTVSTGSTGHATPGGVFSNSREKAGALLEDIQQRANAEHAAPDVDGHRDALGQSARLSGEPRLHPPAF